MRFISKFPEYRFVARADENVFRQVAGGITVKEQVQAPVVLLFNEEVMLPTYERMYALQVFMTGSDRPFGAMPDMQAQPIVDAMGRVVDLTSEYRPDFHFSVFDTETMVMNPNDREWIEQKLLADPAFGKDYILVEKMKVTPPWPTYNEVDLATALNMMKHGGYDVLKVLEYEDAHGHREEWLIEIGKLLAERSIRKAENDSLSITIE